MSPTTIRGVGFIRGKESDRLGDLCRELRAAGVRATETDDGVLVELRAVGTHTGDWTSPDGEHFPASGRSIDSPMAFVMVFDGDRIRSERLYFDQLTLQASLRS